MALAVVVALRPIPNCNCIGSTKSSKFADIAAEAFVLIKTVLIIKPAHILTDELTNASKSTAPSTN